MKNTTNTESLLKQLTNVLRSRLFSADKENAADLAGRFFMNVVVKNVEKEAENQKKQFTETEKQEKYSASLEKHLSDHEKYGKKSKVSNYVRDFYDAKKNREAVHKLTKEDKFNNDGTYADEQESDKETQPRKNQFFDDSGNSRQAQPLTAYTADEDEEYNPADDMTSKDHSFARSSPSLFEEAGLGEVKFDEG